MTAAFREDDERERKMKERKKKKKKGKEGKKEGQLSDRVVSDSSLHGVWGGSHGPLLTP